jgi:hypothetical protein
LANQHVFSRWREVEEELMRRRAFGVFALTAALLLAVPAGALASGARADREDGAWSFTWQRLADLWKEVREAAAGLIPTREAAIAGAPKPSPAPKPPPKTRGNDPNYTGDTGSGLEPNG